MTIRPTKESILENAPQTIGIYMFLAPPKPHSDTAKGGRNRKEIVYIGKSINLRARLLSHLENAKLDAKEAAIINNATEIRVVPVESEFKALIVESQLIQKHRPRYNRIWMDDKSYLYIKVTVKETYPKIAMVRREDDGQSRYFGPFSSIRVAEKILKEIRKVVPYCAQKEIGKRPCFYSKIGLCNPCPNAIEVLGNEKTKQEAKRRYRTNIALIVKILSGKTDIILKGLYKELKTLTREEQFEEALLLRDRILGFERFISERIGIERDLLVVNRRDDAILQLLELLKKYFPSLADIQRIECYDISNLSQKQATAGMVVATAGHVDKSQYRKFKIRNLKLESDFEMLTETMQRRFRNDWPHPDLLVVDGGKPQVRTIREALESLKLSNIPVIGIAKNPDRLVIGIDGMPTVRPPVRHLGFNLIRHLRDEAHRFSKKYHLVLRTRNFIKK